MTNCSTNVKIMNSESKRRPATILDVAKSANVAVGTVSRYLNGFKIRRANREQIEEAIQALGYKRSAVAAALKSDTSHVVGLLAPAFDEFHGAMLQRLSQAVRRDGRALLIYCHGADVKIMEEALDYFVAQRIDALVMTGSEEVYDKVDELIDGGLPVAFYNNDLKGLTADRVLVHNRKASRRAVNHLIDLGHRRIAIISGGLELTSGEERFLGYQDALEERNVPFDPKYFVQGSWTALGGAEAIDKLLGLDEPPTAIFSANFSMTVGALGRLKELGRSVPGDISLISFDDAPLFALHEPGITAVAQPIEQIAEALARTVHERLVQPEEHPSGRTIFLDCDIILRGSTRPVM
ncbi:ribose operon repressor [Burkholderia lata]|nr:ribose operon repressor [Burkholderia lata]